MDLQYVFQKKLFVKYLVNCLTIKQIQNKSQSQTSKGYKETTEC